MKMLRLIGRTVRRMVWETAMDNTTGLAAQMAYQLLFTLAPGLLFLWHLLGLFGTDPAKLHRMFVILKQFLPPDPKVQDILDSALASVVVTGSSGWIANVGIIAGIYLGTMFISTVSRALSHTHGVVEDRHWWSKYIISFFLLFWFGITILVCFNALASIIILLTWMYLTCLLLLLGGKLNAILRRGHERELQNAAPAPQPA